MRIVATADLLDIRKDLEKRKAILEGKLSPIAKKAGEIIRADILKQFQAGGDPQWEPLRPSTIRAKSRAGYPRLSRSGQPGMRQMQNGNFAPSNILIRTGALLSSWTNPQDPNHISEFEDGVVTEGSSLPRAAFHQEGKGVPRRPLRITEAALQQIAAMIPRAWDGETI